MDEATDPQFAMASHMLQQYVVSHVGFQVAVQGGRCWLSSEVCSGSFIKLKVMKGASHVVHAAKKRVRVPTFDTVIETTQAIRAKVDDDGTDNVMESALGSAVSYLEWLKGYWSDECCVE